MSGRLCILRRGSTAAGGAKRAAGPTCSSSHHHHHHQWYSSTTSAARTTAATERMRVAVVGGGASGLSTALHLAPLVSKGLISSPIDVYEASPARKGRSIGVGIWSTALEPFRTSDRPSHQVVWERMTSHGSWVGEVGYRTPKGSWLVHSKLPMTYPPPPLVDGSPHSNDNNNMPGLLFLKECDVQSALRTAVAAEENNSTIRVHSNAPVQGICEDSPHAWSAPLLLRNGQKTERDYHLIIAADGINSQLRKSYAGHSPGERQRLTGASAFPAHSLADPAETKLKNSWARQNHQRVTFLEDRNYTVFRGNAPVQTEDEGSNGLNFQTWGEGRSMRFATVHMAYPSKEKRGTREEKQVWFITIDDEDIVAEPDASKRKDMLLKAFADWHPPICEMVASTPPEEILAERAMAHRFAVKPVVDMNQVLKNVRGKRPPSSGRGPAMVFIGDAFMGVDPILAQGFSVGMEAAADLPKSFEQCFFNYDDLMFDPYELRSLLEARHERRLDRLTCLLRATEIVQALGQPRDGTVAGFLAKNVLRPAMQITPNFVKTKIFDAMLRYSLGLTLSGKSS